MRLFLEIVEGPLRGQKLSLSERTSFGRKDANIVIEDVKLSGIHAFFEYSEKQGWTVVDNKSRNGVWVNGHKEPWALLKDGDVVQLGSSQIICRLQDNNTLTFSDKFKAWATGLYKKAKNNENLLYEIRPEIRLRVIQGVQYGEQWDVFYGPRKAGSESDDIRLYDEAAPEECFEIRAKGTYAYFHTDRQAVVKINKQSLKEKQLVPGDVISVGETEIVIEVNEGHGISR